MLINKVLNNNVITIINEDNEEAVVMGRGIAFQKKKGDAIDEEKIDKIFVLKNKSINNKLVELIKDIPVENLEIAEEIIKYAEEKLATKLNENIYLTLTDHISFSVLRYKSHLEMKNVLLWDIKRLHKNEFEIGLKALEMIKNRLGVELPEDEAATIAMHILNGELNQDMPQIVDIVNLINEMLKIVKYHFNIEFDEESINYYRFVTHLKFFAQRLVNGNYYEDNDNELFEIIKNKYPKSYECTKKIEGFIKQKFNSDLTKEEKLYLIVHTARVVKENQ
ncbi:PRD domain-containing protein [Clostridium sp. Sa3CUN1]|uniref:PRD domain-containing protein n=1 Tax=Clostridium gallinarum TaxID=2762246 RepID=A0ABR8Q1S8_9CLOT|nr:PRD domain-containing protein [Clostridium gallinarum]MBD7914376.1 PRD domain-containing protein [Clostridium gallinarum]